MTLRIVSVAVGVLNLVAAIVWWGLDAYHVLYRVQETLYFDGVRVILSERPIFKFDMFAVITFHVVLGVVFIFAGLAPLLNEDSASETP